MAEMLANMAIGERGSPSSGQREGRRKGRSGLGLDAEASESVPCLMLVFSCKSDQREVTRVEGVL